MKLSTSLPSWSLDTLRQCTAMCLPLLLAADWQYTGAGILCSAGRAPTPAAAQPRHTVTLLRTQPSWLLLTKIYHTVNCLRSFLSSGHLVICISRHPVIWSSGHLVIWLFGHPFIWSSCHPIIFSITMNGLTNGHTTFGLTGLLRRQLEPARANQS